MKYTKVIGNNYKLTVLNNSKLLVNQFPSFIRQNLFTNTKFEQDYKIYNILRTVNFDNKYVIIKSKTNDILLSSIFIQYIHELLNKIKTLRKIYMFNFKSLKLGAKVDIRYDFTITTESNYTELWFRTFNEKYSNSPTSYVANLKYQYSYDMSFFQTVYIDDQRIKGYGARPQARTDSESSLWLKGIYISVC
jgi:hypothetical protein